MTISTTMKINIIIGILIAGIIGAVWLHGYKHGKAQAEGVFAANEMQIQKENAKLLKQVNDDNAKAIESYQKSFAEAIQYRDNELADLRHNLNRSERLYITAKSRQCDGSAVPTKTESAGQPDRAGRVELSTDDAGALWGIAEQAQSVVIKYNALRNICLPLVEVIN